MLVVSINSFLDRAIFSNSSEIPQETDLIQSWSSPQCGWQCPYQLWSQTMSNYWHKLKLSKFSESELFFRQLCPWRAWRAISVLLYFPISMKGIVKLSQCAQSTCPKCSLQGNYDHKLFILLERNWTIWSCFFTIHQKTYKERQR